MNGGSPAVRRGDRSLRSRRGKGAPRDERAEAAVFSSLRAASCFVLSAPRHLEADAVAALSGVAAEKGATREACFVFLLFRSLLLVGARREAPAPLVRECEGLVGKRVVNGREGEWRAHKERRDRSFDLRVAGVTNRQISLTALRACVRGAVGEEGEWLERGLEETRAGTFFAQCASAPVRSSPCCCPRGTSCTRRPPTALLVPPRLRRRRQPP